jgi:hypothetical protein
MDAVAAAITVDVIGVAGFNRDLQATCRLRAGAIAAGAAGAGTAQAADAGESAAGQQQDQSKAEPAGPAAAGICGSVLFPRGCEVLDVISHLTVAMQGRNHPFNRWFPWRQVGDINKLLVCVHFACHYWPQFDGRGCSQPSKTCCCSSK